MTRDDALALADRILELVNSRPSKRILTDWELRDTGQGYAVEVRLYCRKSMGRVFVFCERRNGKWAEVSHLPDTPATEHLLVSDHAQRHWLARGLHHLKD